MLRGEAELGDPFAKQLVLGLGLLFLGKQGAVEATVEVCCCLDGMYTRVFSVVCLMCSKQFSRQCLPLVFLCEC